MVFTCIPESKRTTSVLVDIYQILTQNQPPSFFSSQVLEVQQIIADLKVNVSERAEEIDPYCYRVLTFGMHINM